MTVTKVEIQGPMGLQGPPGSDGQDGRDGVDGVGSEAAVELQSQIDLIRSSQDDTSAFLYNVENESSSDASIITMVPQLLAKTNMRKSAENQANLIIKNISKLYTVDKDNSVKNNVNLVVRQGKIDKIINNDDLSELDTNSYKIVDAAGSYVFPGFRESHYHLYGASEKLLQPDLLNQRTIDGVKNYIQEWVENNPNLILETINGDKFISIVGMDEYLLSDWPVGELPDSRLFPSELSDLPMIINRVDGHATLLNKAAQDLITLRTGVDVRDVSNLIGDLNSVVIGDDYGWYVDQFILLEGETEQKSISTDLLDVKPFTSSQITDTVQENIKRQLSYGYVGLMDMGTENGHISKVLQTEANKKMSHYVAWNYLATFGGIDLEDPLVSKKALDGRHSLYGSKYFVDGGMGGKSALVSKPYADNEATNHPADFSGTNGLVQWHGIPEEDQLQHFTKIMAKGYRLTIHAIGDLGCKKVIDLFEQIYMANPEYKKLRNVIAHCQYIQPEDLVRMAELELIADYQPKHQHTDSRWVFNRLVSLTDENGHPYKTPDGIDITEHDTLLMHYPNLFVEVSKTYSWKTAFDAGVTVCFGSDASVEPSDYRIGMFYATTRLDASDPPRPWLSNSDKEWVGDYAIYDQRVTRQQALRAYTINNAYLMNQEEESGSLEVGKNADFVILEKDLMEVPDVEMLDIKTLATYMRGLNVYNHVGNENYQDKYDHLSGVVNAPHPGHEGPDHGHGHGH